MATILARTDAERRTVKLSVLTGSAANRFYVRLGFVETHREDVDIYYARPPSAQPPASALAR